MAVFPYDYRPARFQHPQMKGYWVRLYFLFDGKTTYTFKKNVDAIENGSLLLEIDNTLCSLFHREILVTADKHPEIFHEIEDFENVLKSNFD